MGIDKKVNLLNLRIDELINGIQEDRKTGKHVLEKLKIFDSVLREIKKEVDDLKGESSDFKKLKDRLSRLIPSVKDRIKDYDNEWKLNLFFKYVLKETKVTVDKKGNKHIQLPVPLKRVSTPGRIVRISKGGHDR